MLPRTWRDGQDPSRLDRREGIGVEAAAGIGRLGDKSEDVDGLPGLRLWRESLDACHLRMIATREAVHHCRGREGEVETWGWVPSALVPSGVCVLPYQGRRICYDVVAFRNWSGEAARS